MSYQIILAIEEVDDDGNVSTDFLDSASVGGFDSLGAASRALNDAIEHMEARR